MKTFIFYLVYVASLLASIFFDWKVIHLEVKSLSTRFPLFRDMLLTIQSFEKKSTEKMQKLLSSRNPVFFLFNSELASRAASSNAVVIYSFLQITEKKHDLGGEKKTKKKKENIIVFSFPFKILSKAIVYCAFIFSFPGKHCWLPSPKIVA